MWSLSFDNISETMDTPGPMLETNMPYAVRL